MDCADVLMMAANGSAVADPSKPPRPGLVGGLRVTWVEAWEECSEGDACARNVGYFATEQGGSPLATRLTPQPITRVMPQKPDIEGCVTPNKLINDEDFKRVFEALWERTQKSGQENGAVIIYEPAANTLHAESLSEGETIREGKSQYAPAIPAMPKSRSEINQHLSNYRSAGRRVALYAIFHTHPDFSPGNSRTGKPSGGDDQVQFDFGNPLGIIRTSKGYSFYDDGILFWPTEAKADQCILLRPSRIR
jgi:hypothetical protein